jgi:hypothetical protein
MFNSQIPETFGKNLSPSQLLKDLEAFSMDTDQKKFNYLRELFLEETDVDEYIQYLDTDQNIDLTKKQLTRLKADLKRFKVYLRDYLQKTAGRIGRFDQRLKKTVEEISNPALTPEQIDKIAHTRKKVARAMRIVEAARGCKGKNLREVAQRVAKVLTPAQRKALFRTVKARFEAHQERHSGLEWAKIQARLEASPEKIWSLNEMERTGGKPDVVGFDEKTGEYIFMDCSAESPKGRRRLCYDREGQDLVQKQIYRAEGNAVDMASAMGIELLTKEQYLELQELGNFDKSTWSWLKTPSDIRKRDRALVGNYCDGGVRVGQDFVGYRDDVVAFRGLLRV